MLHEISEDRIMLDDIAEKIRELEIETRKYAYSVIAEDNKSVIMHAMRMKEINIAIIKSMQSIYARRKALIQVLQEKLDKKE